MPDERRRRTERLFLRYPVRVEGLDGSGKRIDETTHTIVVNRHGGRVLLKNQLVPGQTAKITQVVSGRAAEFRVVGLVGSSGEAGGEWGVECRDEKINFWGISFPPMDESAGSSSVLLECGSCQEVALTIFSMVDYDLLETTGLLIRHCDTCDAETKWIYATNPTRLPETAPVPAPSSSESAPSSPAQLSSPSAPEPALSAPDRPQATALAAEAERRRSQRVSLRLPIRVRNSRDITDLTKSENVSKSGLAFTSDKEFELDEAVKVTCPYDPSGDSIELLGRVVRREVVAGTGRFLYGVDYTK